MQRLCQILLTGALCTVIGCGQSEETTDSSMMGTAGQTSSAGGETVMGQSPDGNQSFGGTQDDSGNGGVMTHLIVLGCTKL